MNHGLHGAHGENTELIRYQKLIRVNPFSPRFKIF
jgi:hypothetical protein